MGLPEDESDRAIVSATVGMARGLKLRNFVEFTVNFPYAIAKSSFPQ
jgi:hypothetical protein